MERTYRKERIGAQTGFVECESAGLEWLRDGRATWP